MLFKALLAVFVFYMLIKVISRLFLQPKKKNSKFRFFYQTFKNVREQQKKAQKQETPENGRVNERLDDIEEADYEDITDDTSESSNK